MPTRLNFTKRKKLLATEVSISVSPSAEGPATFDVGLSLESLRPSADSARVFVEAYQGQARRMRFAFGTVAATVSPAIENRRLDEFDSWEQVMFRVKITDQDGRLVAWRNKIKPRGPGNNKESDLVLFENADLNGRLWAVRFEDDLGPIVQIDRVAGDRHSIGEDERFIASAYPEILRLVLYRAFVEEGEDGEDEDHWSYQWLHGFLIPVLNVSEPPDIDSDTRARVTWIDSAVEAFARQNSFSKLWASQAGEEQR